MRIALLISGGGTTAECIIRACASGRLKGVVPACVISSDKRAGGIARAEKAGVSRKDIVVLKPRDFKNSKEFGKALIKECETRDVEFIGQYGWHVKTPPNVIERFSGMMVNQHPGPVDPGRPDFGGKGMFGRRVHCARLLFVRCVGRDFWTEAVAQRVATDYDRGAVLRKRTVTIVPHDDADTLAARVLPEEHEVQIETLKDFSEGKVEEMVRATPLVMPGEERVLEEVKEVAKMLYPKG